MMIMTMMMTNIMMTMIEEYDDEDDDILIDEGDEITEENIEQLIENSRKGKIKKKTTRKRFIWKIV